jgi:hypothetical protein
VQDNRTPVRPMARPPQFQHPERDSFAVARFQDAIKELTPEARAYVLAWLTKYYGDNGMMFSQQVTQHRKRVRIDDTDFWLVKVPKR